jgi:alpha-L-glutamate ligase-like protein
MLFVSLRKKVSWPLLLALSAIIILYSRSGFNLLSSENFSSQKIYHFQLDMSFHADGDVEVSTYLPRENRRQLIIKENIQAKDMESVDRQDRRGRYMTWLGGTESEQIKYEAEVYTHGVKYDVSKQLLIPQRYQEDLHDYLAETNAIPINHPEIESLWQKIEPNQNTNTYAVLRAIYDYIHLEIENKPFKGFTDALTALRLEAASCNGKSRLFASLARLNNLPTRLVGGVILDGQRKKTSHQWIEVYVSGHWVPFDTLNGYFATIPEHYIELYQGDQNLFRRTSNINFDYRFSSKESKVANAMLSKQEHEMPEMANLLSSLGLDNKSMSIFLLLPLCSVLIAFLKNIVGLKTFGTFMPMLIAAVCVYTGLIIGLISFALILGFAFLGHFALERIHILKVPRLAAIMTLTSIVTLAFTYYQGNNLAIGTGILALFPAVIITFTADRINNMSSHHDIQGILKNSTGTLITIVLCYFILESSILQNAFILLPELFILIIASLIGIGKWTGIRLSELIRFRRVLISTGKVLGINKRNRDYIYKNNDKKLLRLAADKVATKAALSKYDIQCPETIALCTSQNELPLFLETMRNTKQFALKPNNGSRGNGILICRGCDDGHFLLAGGKRCDLISIRQHVVDILIGAFSQSGEEDQAYIEPLIVQHDFFNRLSTQGLSDIRVILDHGIVISAMLRVPTEQSNGKANLHQGAVGISIDIKSGQLIDALLKGKKIEKIPSSQQIIKGSVLPYWESILLISARCYEAIPLGYMGVDICIDKLDGPIVLEVNGRPGLEIQNVQSSPLSLEGM